MSITKFYGGFNPAWRAGHLERKIVDSISDQIKSEYPNLNCVVAVPSWHEPSELVEDIKKINPDVTVICSLSDPLGPIENLLDTIPGRVIKFGYVNNGIKFDFWALICLEFFRQYKFEELQPTNFKYVFLNYNRKPHRHRVDLVALLEQHDLVKHGLITLGESNYTVDDKVEDYLEYGSSDIVGDVGIPNDILSLGKLEIWNSHFLNIVSETQYEYSLNTFISEKIYKPIIGLRPFIVNGSPTIYKWLKDFGFDCFEDIFPVDKLSLNDSIGIKFKNHQIICDVIEELRAANLQELYKSLLPRLINNKTLFYEHARNQRFDIKFEF